MANLTFPQALLDRARKEGAKIALREKDFGICEPAVPVPIPQ